MFVQSSPVQQLRNFVMCFGRNYITHYNSISTSESIPKLVMFMVQLLSSLNNMCLYLHEFFVISSVNKAMPSDGFLYIANAFSSSRRDIKANYQFLSLSLSLFAFRLTPYGCIFLHIFLYISMYFSK